MIFINTNTQEYPLHIGDLKIAGWNEGNPLLEGWHEVFQVDPPQVNEDEVYFQNMPVYNNNRWEMSWGVRKITQEEIDQQSLINEQILRMNSNAPKELQNTPNSENGAPKLWNMDTQSWEDAVV